MKYIVPNWKNNEIFIENLSPIVLFTYNRLEHTKLTIEALKNNIYAKDSHLYIYSDAPKNVEVKNSVEATRLYLKEINGFKSITIIERKENWGLAKNIIDGVTKIVNKYGKIIVLEDDIVTSKYFLKYMNDALEIYKGEPKIMSINGYLYPIIKEDLPEVFFLPTASSWGWATWQTRWCLFEKNPEKLIEQFKEEDIKKFNLDSSFDLWEQVKLNHTKQLNTWAIFWYAVIFQKNGLNLYSKYNYAKNIGADGSGTHKGKNSGMLAVQLSEVSANNFPAEIEENTKALSRVKLFLKMLESKPNVIKKILLKLSKNFKLFS